MLNAESLRILTAIYCQNFFYPLASLYFIMCQNQMKRKAKDSNLCKIDIRLAINRVSRISILQRFIIFGFSSFWWFGFCCFILISSPRRTNMSLPNYALKPVCCGYEVNLSLPFTINWKAPEDTFLKNT